MSDVSRFRAVTELLLGAVYADDRLEGAEQDAVRDLLRETIEEETLPTAIEAMIAHFEPDAFDLDESVAAFVEDPPVTKRRLLELVAAVFDSDGEVDFDEDDYMRTLAEALGMHEDEYKEFVIEYDVEDLPALAPVLLAQPPPVPE